MFAVFILLSGVPLGVSSIRPPTVVPHYLGFWLQEGNIMGYMNASNFVSQYFGTPPYPSSLEIMTFGPYLDGLKGGNGSRNTQASINYWTQVANLADEYDNVHIEYMIAINMSIPREYSLFQQEVQALQPYPSIYSIGVEGEYSPNKTLQNMTTLMGYVNAVERPFVSYSFGIPLSDLPHGAYLIQHTNFPNSINQGSYSQITTLNFGTTSQYVGLSSGYYYPSTFPSAMTCPISANGENSTTQGWNQCVIDTVMRSALNNSPPARQFLNLVVGFANTQSNSNQLWMNATLRNWIWSDPLYQDNFVLSAPALMGGPASLTSSTSSISQGSVSSSRNSSFSSTYQTFSSNNGMPSSLTTHILSSSKNSKHPSSTTSGSRFTFTAEATIITLTFAATAVTGTLYFVFVRRRGRS